MSNTAFVLTNPLSAEMLNFEKSIAYFFAVKNPEKVANHYVQAVRELERLGKEADETTLRMHVLPHLRLAYQEVKDQKNLPFLVDKAAELEFDLFMGGIRNSSFEDDYQTLVRIYEIVFQTKSERMLKAAMLRSFLFKYKVAVFDTTKQLTPSDQAILLTLAKTSEDEMLLLEEELGNKSPKFERVARNKRSQIKCDNLDY